MIMIHYHPYLHSLAVTTTANKQLHAAMSQNPHPRGVAWPEPNWNENTLIGWNMHDQFCIRHCYVVHLDTIALLHEKSVCVCIKGGKIQEAVVGPFLWGNYLLLFLRKGRRIFKWTNKSILESFCFSSFLMEWHRLVWEKRLLFSISWSKNSTHVWTVNQWS